MGESSLRRKGFYLCNGSTSGPPLPGSNLRNKYAERGLAVELLWQRRWAQLGPSWAIILPQQFHCQPPRGILVPQITLLQSAQLESLVNQMKKRDLSNTLHHRLWGPPGAELAR